MEAYIVNPARIHVYPALLLLRIARTAPMDSTYSITRACPIVQQSLLLSLITRNLPLLRARLAHFLANSAPRRLGASLAESATSTLLLELVVNANWEPML